MYVPLFQSCDSCSQFDLLPLTCCLTTADADNVVVLANGDIVETGTYAQLAAKEGGKFRTMLDEQGIGSTAAAAGGGASGDAGIGAVKDAEVDAGAEDTNAAPVEAEAAAVGAATDHGGANNAVVVAPQGGGTSILDVMRSGARLVLCSSKKTTVEFIVSTLVGILGQPFVTLAMLFEIFVVSIVYATRDAAEVSGSRLLPRGTPLHFVRILLTI